LHGLRRRTGGTAIAKHVRLGLGLFLLLLIYDGALRKWVLPSAEQLLFIAKDALLLGMLVYALLNRPRQINASIQPAARALFFLYAAWVLLETGNLNLPSVWWASGAQGAPALYQPDPVAAFGFQQSGRFIPLVGKNLSVGGGAGLCAGVCATGLACRQFH